MHRRVAQCLSDARLDLPKRRPQFLVAPCQRRHRSGLATVTKRAKARRPQESKFAEQWTNMLLDAAVEGDERPGWTHTPRLAGEESRLSSAVSRSSLTTAKHERELLYAPTEDDKDIEVSEEFVKQRLKRGTFITIRRNDLEILAVILKLDRQLAVNTAVSLSVDGSTREHFVEDIMYAVPNFVPSHLAVRCGTEEAPQNDAEHSARVTVLKYLRDMSRVLEGAASSLGIEIANLYPMVKSQAPDQWSEITLDEAVKLIPPKGKFKDLPEIHASAMLKCLLDRSEEFTVASVYESPPRRFHVRPQEHVDTIREVVGMCRLIGERSGPIQKFAAKARNIISASRKRTKDSWNEPPSSHAMKLPVYDRDDLLILSFLRRSLRKARHVQPNAYSLGVSTIIKSIGLYGDMQFDCVVTQLLSDLGILAPWESADTDTRGLLLDQPIDEKSLVTIKDEELVKSPPNPKRNTKIASAHTGPDDLYTEDPLESVRHDFGNMPVYVIDDAGAEELDDGLSVELLPSEPGSTWLHVHVADPTSILPPTHRTAARARRMMSTLYFVHGTDPMLGSLPHLEDLSLGSKSARGKPEPVLTFSIKVGQDGKVLDYKVRAGLVRNVKRLSYDQVDRELGTSVIKPRYPFGDGGKLQDVQKDIPIGDMDKSNLRGLHAIARRLFDAQLRRGYFVIDLPNLMISSSSPRVPPSPASMSTPHEFRGFPDISYAVESFSSSTRGARLMVGESMKVACRVASRFGVDHDIPLIRRHQLPPFAPSEEALQAVLDSRDEWGSPGLQTALSNSVAVSQAGHSLQPNQHWFLGADQGEGYCRVTSPLRRYADLLSHWQIKHALLPSYPTFSRSFMEGILNEVDLKTKGAMKSMKQHSFQWAVKYVYRWQHDPRYDRKKRERDPLAETVAYVAQKPYFLPFLGCRVADVIVPDLGVQGVVHDIDKPLDYYSVGDALRVRMKTLKAPEIRKFVFEEL